MTSSGQRPSVRALPAHPGLRRARSSDDRLDALHEELDRMVQDWQASAGRPCEARAGRLYAAAADASGLSGRALADLMERDERMHRFYRSGSPASVPLACVMRMPKPARLAMIREWIALEKESSEDDADSQRGAA